MAESSLIRMSVSLTRAEMDKLLAIISMRHPARDRATSMTVGELINEEYERSRQRRLAEALGEEKKSE